MLTDFIDYCVEEKTLGDEDRTSRCLTLIQWLKHLARIHALSTLRQTGTDRFCGCDVDRKPFFEQRTEFIMTKLPAPYISA